MFIRNIVSLIKRMELNEVEIKLLRMSLRVYKAQQGLNFDPNWLDLEDYLETL